MKKLLYLLISTVLFLSSFTGCATRIYKKGVEYPEYPDKDVPIYDDAIVFSYKEKSDEWRIEYGTKDDVDDVADFYKEEFEDKNYIITKEFEDKDEYSVEGETDDYTFDIEIEEASGDEADYFDTVVSIKVEEKSTKKKEKTNTKDESNTAEAADDITIINSTSTLVPQEGTASVGNLDEYHVVAEFDSSAFEVASQINISSASSSDFPETDESCFEVSDVGYDFSLDGANYVRPDGKVEVTFKLTPEMLNTLEDESFLQVAYFFDSKWYLQDVESADLENGTATFALYHFSWMFPAKLTKEELRDQKAQEMAENKFNDANNLKRITAEGKSDLEQVISKATGVKDAKTLTAIAEYMLNEKDFTSLMLAGSKGDNTAFSTKMAEMVAKSMNSAAKIGANAALIAGAFQAAGYIWEGDAKGAAESVANAILDSNAYGKLIKLAIKVTDETIKSWKANGIEEMYQAYKNGAEEGWFGYNVEKGEFEEALEQSSAIERQIRIDAVKRYLNIHGGKESELSATNIEEIKKEAIADLKQKFKDRVAQEAEIAKDKEYYKKLLDAFEEDDVDMMVQMDTDLIKELTYEQRLESYTRVTDKILEMTEGRIIEFDGPSDDNEIPIGVITSALRKWYEEDGEAKVRGYLAEQGYLKQLDIDSLAGTWSGTTTFTKVSFDEAIIDAILADLPETSEDGCDQASVTTSIEEQKELEGSSEEVTFIISVSGNIVTMSSIDGDSSDTMTFSYNEKTGALTLINAGSGDENYNYAMNLVVSNTSPPMISGSMVVKSKEMTQGEITVPEGAITMAISLVLHKG